MIQVKTNIRSILKRWDRRLEGWPKRIVTELAKSQWWILTARSALYGAMAPDEYEFIPDFIASIQIERTQLGVALTGGVAEQTSGVVRRGLSAAQSIGGRTNLAAEVDFSRRIEDAENAVREWVTTPYTSRDDPASGKDLTAVDAVPTEELVERLLTIMGFRPLSRGARESEVRQEAAIGLIRRVEAFVQARSNSTDKLLLTSARIRELWAAVFVAWRQMLDMNVPRILKETL